MRLPTPIRLIAMNGALTGEEERDAGISLGSANAHPAWKAAVRQYITAELPFGWIGIGEDITQGCLAAGIPAPVWGRRPGNCWGAQIMHAIRLGLLESLNGYRHMQVPRSHARKSPLLRRTEFF